MRSFSLLDTIGQIEKKNELWASELQKLKL
jgi:hypothetical protein